MPMLLLTDALEIVAMLAHVADSIRAYVSMHPADVAELRRTHNTQARTRRNLRSRNA